MLETQVSELETECPFVNITTNTIDLLFNIPPPDLTRPKIDEIVAVMRELRGRRLVAEASGEKAPRVKKEPAPKAAKPEKISRTPSQVTAITSIEVSDEEDAGF